MRVAPSRPRRFVVAIDGPAASGKGTLARRLANRFGFAHLDTGALYRAAALLLLADGSDPADPVAAEIAARRVEAKMLSDPRLRGTAVAQAASIVATNPAVRRALLEFQRDFARRPPAPAQGAVLDGRDIGSVVCPGADVKLFVTAALDVRAQRRVDELRAAGTPAIYENVVEELWERDARDTARLAAPLAAAPGAVIIDTTALDPDAVLACAADIIIRSLAGSR